MIWSNVGTQYIHESRLSHHVLRGSRMKFQGLGPSSPFDLRRLVSGTCSAPSLVKGPRSIVQQDFHARSPTSAERPTEYRSWEVSRGIRLPPAELPQMMMMGTWLCQASVEVDGGNWKLSGAAALGRVIMERELVGQSARYFGFARRKKAHSRRYPSRSRPEQHNLCQSPRGTTPYISVVVNPSSI